MKIFKNIILGFVFVFLIIVVFFMYVGGKMYSDEEKYIEFSNDIISKYFTDWEVGQVNNMLTAELASDLSQTDAQLVLEKFKELGKLLDVGNTQVIDFRAYLKGFNRITVLSDAKFELSDTVVSLILIEEDNKIKLDSFNINPTDGLPVLGGQSP